MMMELSRAPLGPWLTLQDGRRVRVGDLNLDEVRDNRSLLQGRGVYERQLLFAFVHSNHVHWSLAALRELFRSADRARLRAAGDPLPGHGPFTIYRGVAGHESARRVCGLSWTGSLERAREFAERLDLPSPSVYRITIEESHVLAYVNAKEEEEFLVLLPESAEPQRVE
jgi:hypothetical protein